MSVKSVAFQRILVKIEISIKVLKLSCFSAKIKFQIFFFKYLIESKNSKLESICI